MQPSSAELERQIRERSEALEAAYQQLARREGDLRTLQQQYQTVVEQLAAERQRAQVLVELSSRFGVR
jgi:hypothetical protein